MRYNVHLRSFVKAITWRVSSTCITIVISLLVTGSIKMALTIGSGEVIFKIIFYYFHELVWTKIPLGVPKVKQRSSQDNSGR